MKQKKYLEQLKKAEVYVDIVKIQGTAKLEWVRYGKNDTLMKETKSKAKIITKTILQ